jgi:hypothetical protein
MSTERARERDTHIHTNTSDQLYCERLLFGFSERSRARSRRAGCPAIATDRSMQKSFGNYYRLDFSCSNQAMFQSAGDVTVSANVSTAGKTQIHGSAERQRQTAGPAF